MAITFEKIKRGETYTRAALAQLWGYADYHALARGVVTPKDDNKIVLFVTEEKAPTATGYVDRLAGDTLDWEGPNDHFAEDRMIFADASGDEIHLFYRKRHRLPFTYYGRISVVSYERRVRAPCKFRFRLA